MTKRLSTTEKFLRADERYTKSRNKRWDREVRERRYRRGNKRSRRSSPETGFLVLCGLLLWWAYQDRAVGGWIRANQTLIIVGMGVIGIGIAALMVGVKRRRTEQPQPEVDSGDSLMDHKQFEHEVANILSAMSRCRAVVVGGAGDGGVDVRMYGDQDRLVAIVQCKHVSNPLRVVPPAVIDQMATVKRREKVDTCYVVTNGRFSESTQTRASRLRITLVDGAELDSMRVRFMTLAPVSPAPIPQND